MNTEKTYTNEQLVEKIQQGNTAYLPLLWSQVDKLVLKQAYKYLHRFEHPWFEIDELYNSAYIFFVKAVETYKQDGCTFSTWLTTYFLPEAFKYAALGENYRVRYDKDVLTRTDLLNIDAEIPGTEGATLGDFIADPYNGYEEADNRINREQLKTAIQNVLNQLPAQERAVLIGLYFDNKTVQALANETGKSIYEIKKLKSIAKQHIIYNQSNKMELQQFIDFNTPWYMQVGAHSEESPVEFIVERRERMRERHRLDSPEHLRSITQDYSAEKDILAGQVEIDSAKLDEKIKELEEQLNAMGVQ